jgi:hypothetical protein
VEAVMQTGLALCYVPEKLRERVEAAVEAKRKEEGESWL